MFNSYRLFSVWVSHPQSGYHPSSVFHRPGESRVAAGKIRKKIKKELIGTSDYPSNKIFTISNFITFTRLILTGVFLYLFVTDFNRYVALVIYAVAASTDWLDGQIARMTKTVSWLGKLLDPIVDRALLFCGVVGLVAREELPLWICLAIVGRDIYLFLGNFVVKRYHKRPIDVVFVGKLATALLMSGFTLMLLGLPVLDGLGIVPDSLTWLPGLNCTPVPLGIFFVYAGVCCSLLTGLVYTVKGLQAIRNAIAHPEDEDEDFLNPDIDEGEEASAAETA